MKKECQRYIEILMFGDPALFTMAKKGLYELWHSDVKGFHKVAPVAFGYMERFDECASLKHQAAFASGLRMFYLSLADDHFDILKNFTLKVIQSPHGHVREAIRKTSDWLFCSLTSRIDPFVMDGQLTQKHKKAEKEAKKQYRTYVREIEKLIEQYDIDKDNASEYVDELKPSIYKSLQLLWCDVTRGNICGQLDNEQPSDELQHKREEIENKIIRILDKYHIDDVNIHVIKDIIFYEEGNKTFHLFIGMLFERIPAKDLNEMNSILNIFTDAWNHFPHKTLGGKCPVQIIDVHDN